MTNTFRNKCKYIGKMVDKWIALIGLHILAYVFDGDLIYICFGIDASIIGIKLMNGKVKE